MLSVCWVVEVRYEQTRESPAAARFMVIDQVGGSLDDAKASAQSYYDQHVASSDSTELFWVEGALKGKGRCYYAHTRFLTFRLCS